MYIYRGKLNFKLEDNGESADNEGITLMFPLEFHLGYPAYACWQWSEKDGSTKVPAFYASTIDEFISTPSSTRVGFNYNGDYIFDVTFTDRIDKLSFIMRGKNGGISDQTDLLLVYKPNPDVPRDATVPRIYTGKLTNYSPYAVDELLVVIAPGSVDEEKTICAFWQWTQTPENDEKQNVDDVTTISDVTPVEEGDDAGQSFRFYYGDKAYTFDVKMLEVSKTLKLTMKDTKDVSTGELAFRLEDLNPSLSHGPGGRWPDTTTTAYNDTEEFITCTIFDSSTIYTDQAITAAGAVLGIAGLVTLVPGVNVAVGIFVACAGMAVALGGVSQMIPPSGDAISQALFPGDMMKRTSTWRLLFSDNDIQIHLVRVDNTGDQPRLVVSTGTVKGVGEKTKKLSELMPGKAGAPTYSELLSILLPSPTIHLSIYRIITIKWFTINRTGQDVNKMEGKNIPNSLTTFAKSPPKWYGTLDEYYDLVKNTDPNDQKLFEYSANDSVVFVQIDGDGPGASHAKVLPVLTDEGLVLLLKLNNCIMKNVGQRDFGEQKDEKAVGDKIVENNNYRSYSWITNVKDSKKHLYGNLPPYRSPLLPTLCYSDDPDNCVLFIASSFKPVMSLVE